MTTGGDANEATILAKTGHKVQLETVIGEDEAGKFDIKSLSGMRYGHQK